MGRRKDRARPLRERVDERIGLDQAVNICRSVVVKNSPTLSNRAITVICCGRGTILVYVTTTEAKGGRRKNILDIHARHRFAIHACPNRHHTCIFSEPNGFQKWNIIFHMGQLYNLKAVQGTGSQALYSLYTLDLIRLLFIVYALFNYLLFISHYVFFI